MPRHRAPRERSRLSLPVWHLLMSAVLVTALAVTALLVVPGRDGADADATASTPETERPTTASATHEAPAVSRSRPRAAYQAERLAPAANAQARRATQVIHQRKVRAERRAARIAARKKRERQERRRERRLAQMEKSSSFRVGALNVLGSQHSAGPGGYGPGTTRAAMAAGLIINRGIDVLTLSEVQDDQLAVFNNRLAGYSIWPQHSLGSNGQRLQVAWRASRYEMLDGGSVTYTFASQRIPMPYVLLRDRASGAQFWVISVHLSAGGLEGERDSGTAIAISLMQRLMAETGKPVIIGGDVNEHEEFFYKVCNATGFLAANGGGVGCTLPPRPLRVDWIMGGGGNGATFSGYVQDGATLGRISDHYFIHADVSVVDPGDRS